METNHMNLQTRPRVVYLLNGREIDTSLIPDIEYSNNSIIDSCLSSAGDDPAIFKNYDPNNNIIKVHISMNFNGHS